MLILGIDPGLVNCGIAIIENGHLIDARVAPPFKDVELFTEWLAVILKEGCYGLLAVEDWIYRGASKGNSAILVPKMVGIIMGMSRGLDIPCITLNTNTWKKALTNEAHPSDDQIRKWVEQTLNYKFRICKTKKEAAYFHHAIEAAAIALVGERRLKK